MKIAFALILVVAIISTLLAIYLNPSKKSKGMVPECNGHSTTYDSLLEKCDCLHDTTGQNCEKCKDGYFGDPAGKLGAVRQCQSSDCNSNIDLDVQGNCHPTTGKCLKCIRNTGGANCEKCRLGFFGNALTTKLSSDSPTCQPCECNQNGSLYYGKTSYPRCSPVTGECKCKANVVGYHCNKCEDGYVNIESGNGCIHVSRFLDDYFKDYYDI